MMKSRIKPLPFWNSLLYFGIPTLIAFLIVYMVMPYFNRYGLPIFYNYLIVYATVPMLMLIGAAIFFFYRDENDHTFSGFMKRFRLNKMGGKSWLWTILLTLFMFASAGLLSFVSRWLASIPLLNPPDFWPDELNPAKGGGPMGSGIPTSLMGVPLSGNWWVFFAMFASLIIATLGEELWWRGYILPRQEVAYGKNTWIIHGVLWTLFHAFAPWNLVTLLPGCLALSFVAQKLKNTWPGIIAHGVANGLLVLVITAMGILN